MRIVWAALVALPAGDAVLQVGLQQSRVGAARYFAESAEGSLRPGGQNPLIDGPDVQRVSQFIERAVQPAPVEVGTLGAPAPVHDLGPRSLGLRASGVVHRGASADAMALNESDALRLAWRHSRIDVELAEAVERGAGKTLIGAERAGFQQDDSSGTSFGPGHERMSRRETGSAGPDDENGFLSGESLRQAGERSRPLVQQLPRLGRRRRLDLGAGGRHQRHSVEHRECGGARAIPDTIPELRQLAVAPAHHRFDRGQNSLGIDHQARRPIDVLQEEPVQVGPSPRQRSSRESQFGQECTRHHEQRQVKGESKTERRVVEELVEPSDGFGRVVQLVRFEAQDRLGECGEESAFDGEHRHGDLRVRNGALHSAYRDAAPPVGSWGTS